MKINCSDLVNNNYRQIQELRTQISIKQAQLDSILNDNSTFFTFKFQIDLNQLRQSGESLLEILRVFNSQLTNNGNNRNDISCIMPSMVYSTNTNQTVRTLMQQKQSNSIVNLDYSNSIIKQNSLESFLNFESSYKAKCFLFSELIQSYADSSMALNRIYLNSQPNKLNLMHELESSKHLQIELKDLLNTCMANDQMLFQVYFEQIKSRLSEINEKNNFLSKVLKLINFIFFIKKIKSLKLYFYIEIKDRESYGVMVGATGSKRVHFGKYIGSWQGSGLLFKQTG